MSVIILTGRPRQGKGIAAAWFAQQAMSSGRTVVADYFMEGALRLYSYNDIASSHFQACLFIFDEAGSTFAARETMSLDQLVFASATMHGHVGVDVIMQAQSLMFVDIQWRRLAEFVIVVKRFGPDGHYNVKAILSGEKPEITNGKVRDTRVPWYKRPWFHRLEYYHVMDFNEYGELKANAKPRKTQWIMWTRKLARMYNTQQIMVPPHLAKAYEVEVSNSFIRRWSTKPMRKGEVLSQHELAHIPTQVFVNKDGDIEQDHRSAYDIALARGYYDDGLDTNSLLTAKNITGTLKKVERLPISDSVEIVPYAAPKGYSNGYDHGRIRDNGRHSNGSSGTGSTTIGWDASRPRKPGSKRNIEEDNTIQESEGGTTGENPLDSFGSDERESS